MQRKEMAVKRRLESSPQGFNLAGLRHNPRRSKMRMLMNASDTRVMKKRIPKQRLPTR